MKAAALVAGCLLNTAVLHGQTASYEVKRTFLSPDSSATASVATQTSIARRDLPPLHSLGAISNGSFVLFTELPPSQIFREYHGRAWFEDVQPRWVDNRFLVFEDEFGLAIADVQNRRMLVNHVFMAYEKSPRGDRWAAIRRRNTARHQENLDDYFEDTVFVIDPYDVANRIANATEDNFVAQMKGVHPGRHRTRKAAMGARRFGVRGSHVEGRHSRSGALRYGPT